MSNEYSPKSYAVAVSLCMIFGILGLHHFYTGRYLLGLFDFGLFIVSTACLITGILTGNWSLVVAAAVGYILDFAHSVYVTIRLLIGEETDGQGRLISYRVEEMG